MALELGTFGSLTAPHLGTSRILRQPQPRELHAERTLPTPYGTGMVPFSFTPMLRLQALWPWPAA
jgi:hypothetical protein